MNTNHVNGKFVQNVFKAFWEERGSDCVSIVEAMSKREPWQQDARVESRLVGLFHAISKSPIESIMDEIKTKDYVTLMSWISSEKALALLTKFETIRPGLTIQLLNEGTESPMGVSFKIFVERILTFARAKMMGELFDSARVERVTEMASGAMEKYKGRNNE